MARTAGTAKSGTSRRRKGPAPRGTASKKTTPRSATKSKTAAKETVKSWRKKRAISASNRKAKKDPPKDPPPAAVAAKVDSAATAKKSTPAKPKHAKKQPAKKKEKKKPGTGKTKAARSPVPPSPQRTKKPRTASTGSPNAKAPRVVLPTLPLRPASPAVNVVIDGPPTPSKPPIPHGILLGNRIVQSFPVPFIHPNGTECVKDVLYLGTATDYCPVTPGLTVTNDRSRGCRLKAGGLDIGLYRIAFDDGDTEDMDPDEVYEGYLLYEEQRSYRLKAHQPRAFTYQRKPRKLCGEGKQVMAKDADAPDGTEATPEAGERVLKRHKNPALTRESFLELDQERVGYWEYFQDFNEETGVKRPEPLVAPGTGPGMDTVPRAVADGALAPARGTFQSSSSSSTSRPQTALHTQSGKGRAFPQRFMGPGGNDRVVMPFRVTAWPPSEALPQTVEQGHPSSEVGKEEELSEEWSPELEPSQTSTQTAGEQPSTECRPPQGVDDGYMTADEFQPGESSGITKAAAAGKRNWNAAHDGQEVVTRSIRLRQNDAVKRGGDDESVKEEESKGRPKVKDEDGTTRPGLAVRVWRAIFQG